MSEHDDLSTINSFANEIEIIANRLARLMPAVRLARQALRERRPGAIWHSQFEGWVDASDGGAAEILGFARVERARERLLEILREP